MAPKQRADRRGLAPTLLGAYIGETVKVHLRDDRVLTGILDSVYGDFGLVLGKCSGVFAEGPRRKQAAPATELAFVSGALVRMVELPGDADDHLRRAWKLQQTVRAQQAMRTIGEKKPR